ncbi:hypothetical protein G9272_32190 [Streptomyces asoensis]|uniref:Uncharacterized protein n=1 Tax=Streptomyces asoensis TaxID=249586 RepID=A0A6M4WWA8_9ACTN|nr:hypothetical protein [Streptomyces asoensis]QJT04379.1 hypothetical protein G9272_32190 [Streptomyces asoensis]
MTTAATNLRTVALHWADLHEAVGQPTQLGAFGLGLRGYLARLEDADRAEFNYDRAHAAHLRSQERDPIQIGVRPVPVRLHILDTMRAVEASLHGTADQIAADVQRAPMPFAPSNWPAADRERRNQLARADAADPRRWRWTGRRRSASYTALWLLARIEGKGGPFRALTVVQLEQIGVVAAGAAERVERALDIAAQRRTLEQRHGCGGAIDVHGGEGRPPLAHCTGCGVVWAEGVIAA